MMGQKIRLIEITTEELSEMSNRFNPDYAIPPGETIKENMEYRHISKEVLAEKLGITIVKLDKLLEGNARITEKLSERLEDTLYISSIMWLNLEQNYRKALKKKENK